MRLNRVYLHGACVQWNIAVTVLSASSMALLRRRIPGAPCVEADEDGCPVEMSRWREAWMILRSGLSKVRRTASEGVEALKLELGSTTPVGKPGLVGFQYVVDKWTPHRLEAVRARYSLTAPTMPQPHCTSPPTPQPLHLLRHLPLSLGALCHLPSALAPPASPPIASTRLPLRLHSHPIAPSPACRCPFQVLEDALREALLDVQIGSRHMQIRRFSVGTKPPQLLAARVYDLGPDTLGFDVDTSWESEMVAQLEAVSPEEAEEIGYGPSIAAPAVPVSVRNFRFEGPVRVVVTNLTRADPGYGAILLSLPRTPEIGLDVRVAGGEVTKVPWFRDELARAMQSSMADQ